MWFGEHSLDHLDANNPSPNSLLLRFEPSPHRHLEEQLQELDDLQHTSCPLVRGALVRPRMGVPRVRGRGDHGPVFWIGLEPSGKDSIMVQRE